MQIKSVTRLEAAALHDAANLIVSDMRVVLDKAKQGCRTCDHVRGSGCALADGAQIPDDVIRVGCDSWVTDPIPF